MLRRFVRFLHLSSVFYVYDKTPAEASTLVIASFALVLFFYHYYCFGWLLMAAQSFRFAVMDS